MDNAFWNLLTLIRVSISFVISWPLGVADYVLGFFCKLMFLAFYIGESLPIVGPKIHSVLDFIVQLPVIRWTLKYKTD